MSDNTLKIWDWSSNTILFSLNWYPNQAFIHSQVKFLSNGLLVAPFSGTTSNAYDPTTGQVRYSLINSGSVIALEQLSNGNLISSSDDNYLRIWNSTSGQLLFQLNTGRFMHYALKQTSTSNLVASACSDNNVYLWDVNTLQQVDILTGLPDTVYFLDQMTNGLLIAGSGWSSVAIRLWNMTTGITFSSLSFSTVITCMKLISSNQLVLGFETNYIKIFNISSTTTNELILAQTVNLVTNSQVNDMRLTMENILLIAQKDGSVFFFNIDSKTFVQALTPVSSSVNVFAFDLIGS
jgi:WD40 repeat protein